MAAGAIYPLLYLRQNFEVSILESFGITITELSQCYAMLGVLFVLTYVPSGWLADKASPRLLVAFSLAGTGLLGFWFSTMPSFTELKIIDMLRRALVLDLTCVVISSKLFTADKLGWNLHLEWVRNFGSQFQQNEVNERQHDNRTQYFNCR